MPEGAPVTVVNKATQPIATAASTTSGLGATAATPEYVKAASYTYLGKGRLTAAATTTPIPTVPAGATIAIVQNKGTADANWAVGVATANDQAIIATTGIVTLDLGNVTLNSLQFIATGTVDLRFAFYS